MANMKNRLSPAEFDALTLSTPEGVAAYKETRAELEDARLARQLGLMLRQVRIDEGLSQSEVAARAEIDQGDLSRLEKGEGIRGATVGMVERVALAMHRRVQMTLIKLDAAVVREDPKKVTTGM